MQFPNAAMFTAMFATVLLNVCTDVLESLQRTLTQPRLASTAANAPTSSFTVGSTTIKLRLASARPRAVLYSTSP